MLNKEVVKDKSREIHRGNGHERKLPFKNVNSPIILKIPRFQANAFHALLNWARLKARYSFRR